MRRIGLHPDEPLLLVTSDYNDQIRLRIKSIHGARWDGKARCWQVPLAERERLLAQLEPFGFEVADDVGAAPVPAVSEVPEPDTLTVSQVNHRIGGAVLHAFPAGVWVRGEVASFDKGAKRRHWYFELIEKSARGDDVAARLPIVVFSSRRERIERRLARAAEPLSLRDGLEVRLYGRLEFYSQRGRLQLVVENIDPDFSFGQLARRRREILEALTTENLLDCNTQRPWPALPLRIGLITAADSDALHDFVTTLEQSPYAFRVAHIATAVQGQQLEREVSAALRRFERARSQLDVVAIVRGGGSRSDLSWFDNLNLARRVAQHPLKIVLGIGHERDQSVIAAVAHAEKTPSAAAEWLVALVATADERVERLARQLGLATRGQLARAAEGSRQRQTRLVTIARSRISHARQHIERQLSDGLRRAVRARLEVASHRLGGFTARLSADRWLGQLGRVRALHRQRIDRLARAVRVQLASETMRLNGFAERRRLLDPAQTLARGYAIVHGPDGAVVRRIGDAPIRSSIQIELYRGRLTARVTDHHPANEDEA